MLQLAGFDLKTRLGASAHAFAGVAQGHAEAALVDFLWQYPVVWRRPASADFCRRTHCRMPRDIQPRRAHGIRAGPTRFAVAFQRPAPAARRPVGLFHLNHATA